MALLLGSKAKMMLTQNCVVSKQKCIDYIETFLFMVTFLNNLYIFVLYQKKKEYSLYKKNDRLFFFGYNTSGVNLKTILCPKPSYNEPSYKEVLA